MNRTCPAAAVAAVIASPLARHLGPGMLVYPLGGKEGSWSEIEDGNGNPGWVPNEALEPKK